MFFKLGNFCFSIFQFTSSVLSLLLSAFFNSKISVCFDLSVRDNIHRLPSGSAKSIFLPSFPPIYLELYIHQWWTGDFTQYGHGERYFLLDLYFFLKLTYHLVTLPLVTRKEHKNIHELRGRQWESWERAFGFHTEQWKEIGGVWIKVWHGMAYLSQGL